MHFDNAFSNFGRLTCIKGDPRGVAPAIYVL